MGNRRQASEFFLSGVVNYIYHTRLVASTPSYGSVSFPYPPKQLEDLFDDFPEARLLEVPIDVTDTKTGEARTCWGDQTFTFWHIVFEKEEDMLAFELSRGHDVGMKFGCPAIVPYFDNF